MDIRNSQSGTRIEIVSKDDFNFYWDNKLVTPKFWPIQVRRSGSCIRGTDLWYAVSSLCWDKDVPEVEPLSSEKYLVKCDPLVYTEKTGFIAWWHEEWLIFWLWRKETGKEEHITEFLIKTVGKQASGILIVNPRQFSQFMNLAQSIQKYSESVRV